MSHLLYFSSFSPEKYQEYFQPITEDMLNILLDPQGDGMCASDADPKNLQKLCEHIATNGLSYKGLDAKFVEMLDQLIHYDIFNSNDEKMEFETYPESGGGFHISLGEELLKHSGIIYHEGMGKLKDYPMLQFCMEGRRLSESVPMNEYEAYVIFNTEELLRLRNEIKSIVDRDKPWKLDNWNSPEEFLECIEAELINPVESAIAKNRWLYGGWY